MLNDDQLDQALARLPRDAVTRVRLLLAEGWSLEAKRLLSLVTDVDTADEIHASLVRRYYEPPVPSETDEEW